MVTMMLKRRLGITNGGTSVGTLDMEMRQMTLMTKIFLPATLLKHLKMKVCLKMKAVCLRLNRGTEALQVLIPKVATGDIWGKVPKDPALLRRLKITVMRKKKREAEVAEVGQRLPTPTWRVMMRSMPSRRGNLETLLPRQVPVKQKLSTPTPRVMMTSMCSAQSRRGKLETRLPRRVPVKQKLLLRNHLRG